MAQYEFGFQSVAPTSGSNYFDMLPTTSDVTVREMHLMTNAATASPMGLFRTTANGTRTSPTVPTAAQCALYGSTSNAPLAGFATAWSVQPTLSTNPLRRFNAAASIGAGVIWTWYGPNGGLRVPAGSTIILNAVGGAGSVLNVTIVWEE